MTIAYIGVTFMYKIIAILNYFTLSFKLFYNIFNKK